VQSSLVTTLRTPDGERVDYPARLITVEQTEAQHPGLEGRLRGYILQADLNSPEFAGLRDAIVRLGRSVYIDEVKFLEWIATRRASPPDRARNPLGRGGKKAASTPAKRTRAAFARAHSSCATQCKICSNCNGSGVDPSADIGCSCCAGSGYERRDD